jgi:hypothetical protein
MIASLVMIAQSNQPTRMQLTILSREPCHLCDVIHRMALSLQSEFNLEIQKTSIEGDAGLLERYGTRIPVVLIEGVERCGGTITEGDLRRAIKRARWRRPISRILSRLGYAPTRR